MPEPIRILDFEPASRDVREEIVSGLNAKPKQLPAKFFYDARGSRLFERITELDEYYLTRTETAIMTAHAAEMAIRVGANAALVEFGSGASVKTRLLLDELESPAAYIPIDISRGHLEEAAKAIAKAYPHIQVLPVCADYEQRFDLPRPERAPARRVVYFPGSTIGNFHPDDAVAFLQRAARLAQAGEGVGGLLIGIDLRKDPRVLVRAYDDADGVTAAFNLNVLHRLNKEFDGTFDLARFRHLVRYDTHAHRIEMHLQSLADQTVSVAGARFVLRKGETIWTESSYKYTVTGFAHLAARAGFSLRRAWTDPDDRFGVLYLEIARAGRQAAQR